MAADGAGLPGLSIRRPVLVLVLNLLIALAGVASILAVDIRELPDVDRPVVSIIANFPGASPETLDTEVTSVIEGAVARVSGVNEIRASSEENSGRVFLEFQPGTDLDVAASDVREAVSRVSRRLPEGLEDLTVIKADSNSGSIINIAVYSESLLPDDVTRIIERDIIPELISIEGVADVSIFGESERQLRVVVDPMRLASLGLSVADVSAVLRDATFDVPAGSFRSEDQELLVRADASVYTADQVAGIIVRGDTRVGDVAKVYFSPADIKRYTRFNGRQVISLGITRKAQSNTIEISDGVHAAVSRLNQRYGDLNLTVTSDDAEFIRSSVEEVLFTLSITVLIVISIIGLFTASLRATLIPSVAIPVALIGTVAAIWLLGFSINLLTLLALVLATGLVVDDAIVVLENIQRRRKLGLGGRAAAVLGTRQVFFAVVTATAVLISVFVPIAFLPGTAGRLFREFGLVLAVAMAISCFVSLSLVPVMASRLPARQRENRFTSLLFRLGAALSSGYSRALHLALDHPALVLLVTLGLGGGALSVYRSLGQELLPAEDRGLINVNLAGPVGVGIGYMDRHTRRVEDLLRPLVETGEVESLFTVVGTFDPNQARVTAPLVDWEARSRSQQAIMQSLEGPLLEMTGARVNLSSSNSLSMRGAGGGITVALTGNDYLRIYEVAKVFARAVEESLPALTQPRVSYEPTQPQLMLVIDRRRAADLGVNLENLAATLRVMIDGDEVVELNIDDAAVPILLEASTGEINDPGDLVNLYVSSGSGKLVPLTSVVSLREEGIAGDLNRHAQRRAIEVEMNVSPGYPLQSAVDDLRDLAAEVLPGDISMIMLGDAATLEETSRDVTLIYIIAFIVVFLVLCAQFEGLTSAIVVILMVPFGIAAAVFALWLTGTSVNIYSQIGLVMLIGLMAKNGVLVVEFADQLRDRGYPVRRAIEEGAQIRLRPVAMTMMCTVLGALPLILRGGAGAEARSSIGWVIFGGLGLAVMFTLILTPVLYLLLARFSQARAQETQRLEEELQQAQAAGEVA